MQGFSGLGKSLLLRAIADLDPNQGEVMLDGKSREIMLAPQWREQVIYLLSEPGWWSDDVAAHFLSWEEVIPCQRRFGARLCSCLSPGERQRLALVRALVLRPRVLSFTVLFLIYKASRFSWI